MKSRIFFPRLLSLLFTASVSVFAQSSDWLGSLPQPHNYTLKRVSSFDRSGGNADFRAIPSSTNPGPAPSHTSGSRWPTMNRIT